jgi:hypothetical protein
MLFTAKAQGTQRGEEGTQISIDFHRLQNVGHGLQDLQDFGE